jgi:muramidase (phage lysozyme)
MKSFSIFRLYTVNEIAEITGLKENKITFLLRKGTLKGKKIGRIWCSRGFYICEMMSQNRRLKELKNKFETREK